VNGNSNILTVAVVQRRIIPSDPPGNLLATLDLLKACSEQKIDLFVLSELWTTGILDPTDPATGELVEEVSGPTVEALRSFCAERQCYILAGSIPVRKQKQIFNTSFLIDPSGNPILEYSKIQLFPPMREEAIFTPGETLSACEVNGVGVGVVICYDLRFPNLVRRLAHSGCEVILVPALWPQARIDHWEILLRARAVENQLYMIGANGIFSQNDMFFPGHSLIVGPAGEMLNSPEMREMVIVRKIDIDRVRQLRREICYIDAEKEIRNVIWKSRLEP